MLTADAYREYNTLRNSGGRGDKTEEKPKSEAWGSHLNKTNSVNDEKSDTTHSKGSLLSKLSQKLYQNYSSHSRKVG